jgi:ketosteroid isomerase-like protein
VAYEAIRQLAESFFNAIERGDLQAVHAIYAPDAIIWHNTDGAAVTVEENLETLESVIRHLPERHYTRRRLDVFEGGFVEQHVLKGKLADGGEVSLAACVVCRVREGRITRLDEYFDSAELAKWRQA